MSVKICCDFCDRPLDIETVDTDYGPVEYSRSYSCEMKDLKIQKLFPQLCKSCTENIDQIMVFAKDEWLKQVDISVKNSRINDARRELLGTKG